MEKVLSEGISQHIDVFSSLKPGSPVYFFLLHCCHGLTAITNKVPQPLAQSPPPVGWGGELEKDETHQLK